MLADQLLVDRADDVGVDFDGLEIEQRHTEFMGCCNAMARGSLVLTR